jgi:hypothetical protein
LLSPRLSRGDFSFLVKNLKFRHSAADPSGPAAFFVAKNMQAMQKNYLT